MAVTAFEQPTGRIVAGGGRRGRAGLAAWGVLLGVVTLVGVVGGLGEDGRRPERVATREAIVEPVPRVQPAEPAIARVLVLAQPPPAVRGPRIGVRGQVAAGVERVEIALLREGEQVAHLTARPTADGGFRTALILPAPREPGAVTVVAIARDRHGIPVATARHDVRVGPLRVGFVTVDRRPLGEDGLMGGLAGIGAGSGGAEDAGSRDYRPPWPQRSIER